MMNKLQHNLQNSDERHPQYKGNLRVQVCPVCKEFIGDMPGMRDAVCHNCGFKDPCCE